MGAAGVMAGIQAVGAVRQGMAEKAAAETNANVSRQKARTALAQADVDAQAQSVESRKVLGTISADFGASGVTTEGSVLDVLEESAALAELDRQDILYKGRVEAMGYETDARIFDSQAQQAVINTMFNVAGAGASAVQPKAAPTKPPTTPVT